MSILENSDEMFFGRTEKSGDQILLDRHTENGKNICICFYDFFAFFERSKFQIPFLATFWLRSHNVAIM
jgi:hypothetical protein